MLQADLRIGLKIKNNDSGEIRVILGIGSTAYFARSLMTGREELYSYAHLKYGWEIADES